MVTTAVFRISLIFVASLCAALPSLAWESGPILRQRLVAYPTKCSFDGTPTGLLALENIEGVSSIHTLLTPVQFNYGSLKEPPYLFVTTCKSPKFDFFPGKPWFASRGEGLEFVKGRDFYPGPGIKHFSVDVSLFGRSTPNHWGLAKDAHIVKLQINDGRGSVGMNMLAPGGSPDYFLTDFVVSKLEILPEDSTVDAASKLDAFLKPYGDSNSSEWKSVNDLLVELIDEALKNDKAFATTAGDYKKTPPVIYKAYTASWLPELQQLKIVFYAGARYTFFELRKKAVLGGVPKHLYSPPHGFVMRLEPCGSFGSEFTRTQIYDKNGKLKADTSDHDTYIFRGFDNFGPSGWWGEQLNTQK